MKPKTSETAADEPVMPAELRRLQREYAADLLERVMKAPCPRCGARPGKPCKSQYRRGDIAGAHAQRNNEAKKLGFVKGKYWRE